MRKLFLQMFISVDGYFEGPSHELDWFIHDDEFHDYVKEMLASIDGILLGRVTYEGFAAHWPNSTQDEAAKMNSLSKYVASTTLREATWSNTTIIADDVVAAVARIKEERGNDLAIFGSSIGFESSMPSAPGTVTEPLFSLCLKMRWLPVCRTWIQPSALSSLIISRTLTTSQRSRRLFSIQRRGRLRLV